MGMYDNLVCKYPLPGKPPSYIDENHQFQTKDLDCCLDTYTIDKDGKLSVSRMYWDKNTPNNEFLFEQGVIEFYTTNIRACGPGTYTANGEDADTVSYKAVFKDGKIESIIETEREIRPALPISKMDVYRGVDVPQERYEESLLGKKIYVLWGGRDNGYYAEVVAESSTQLCVKKEDERLELLSRQDRDHIFWDNEQVAKEEKAKKEEHWKKRSDEFKAYEEEWKKLKAEENAN